MPQTGEYSLYFHVPFCKKKCDYCSFYVIPDQERFQDLYLEALKIEWSLRSPCLSKDRKLTSIYFGGGTPTLLGLEKIESILSWISPSSDVEISLEANPDTLLMCNQINRMSIGVQSFDNVLLSALTRDHHAQKAREAVLRIVQFGIKNLSIDLMYDIPNQTLKNWENTLDEAIALPITHLSLYNLTIEPHTSFYKRKEALQTQMPNERASFLMLEKAISKLENAGFARYEISAFAKSGFQSRHNIGYWQGRPFLGFGPSAFSYWGGARFQNHANLNRYAKCLKQGVSPIHFHEKLSYIESLKERLAIGLRLLAGVQKWPSELKSSQEKLSSEGFLDPSGIKLSNKGLLFHDTVAQIIMNSK